MNSTSTTSPAGSLPPCSLAGQADQCSYSSVSLAGTVGKIFIDIFIFIRDLTANGCHVNESLNLFGFRNPSETSLNILKAEQKGADG